MIESQKLNLKLKQVQSYLSLDNVQYCITAVRKNQTTNHSSKGNIAIIIKQSKFSSTKSIYNLNKTNIKEWY